MLRNNPKFVHEIYNSYLDKENELNKIKYKKHEGWFSASSSGSCIKQLYYKTHDFQPQPLDKKTKRLLRQGTVMHQDFEAAVKESDLYNDPDNTVLTEYFIEEPELHLIGHLDWAIITDKEIFFADWKTIGDYPWKLRFGRKKDKNPSQHYALQVGTYAMALCNESNNPEAELYIIWYNKNDSRLKTQSIPIDYIDFAWEYWTSVNETIKELGEKIRTVAPGTMVDIPAENWQCKYCSFKQQCDKDVLDEEI